MLVTIVIPVFNGAQTISKLADELIRNLYPDNLELVLVNDGSQDRSHEECREIADRYGGIVKYVRLAKNFGEHNAVMAGLNYAKGDYVVVMDDDFQNPPSEVVRLVDEAIEGNYDVVYSYYEKKKHNLVRNMGSKFNDLIANIMLKKPKDLYLSSFKCLNRFAAQEIIKYKGPFPYIDGLVLRATRNISKVLVRHEKREKGRSNYNLKKMVALWMNMFVNFSVVPLRVSTWLGFIFSFIGIILSLVTVYEKFVRPDVPLGWPSLIIVIVMFSGTQLLILGILGEYLGRLFLMDNMTPQYVVREMLGHEKNDKKEN